MRRELTPRQLFVVKKWAAHNGDIKRTASELGIAVTTLGAHLSTTQLKLNLGSRFELAVWVTKNGLV